MLPVIVLVGRPNVGKSTLFNRLTRSRDALVADFPGLTRDRIYGRGKVGEHSFMVVDTGGLSGDEQGIDGEMAHQVMNAIGEADGVLFLVDGRDGLTAGDEQIAQALRRSGKPVYLAVNKSEGLDHIEVAADFHALGIGEPRIISANRGSGVNALMQRVLDAYPCADADEEDGEEKIKVAVIGRPNVGKSTLINRLLGEDRVVVYDQPGTTRDSIYVPFERDDRHYTLIDTAGIRRKARVNEAIEKFSVIKSMHAASEANVVILVLDARERISDQDASLAGFATESGRAMIVVFNKWDGLDADQKRLVKEDIDRKLPFLHFARKYFISALHGSGVGDLWSAINACYKAAMMKVPTAELTKTLERALDRHQPPLVKGRRIKLRYAHQGGRNPPIIVIHGNQTAEVPPAYQRYLANAFREEYGFAGTPVRIEFRSGDNPYKDKKNKLTPRQVRRRKRLMRFVKRGK